MLCKAEFYRMRYSENLELCHFFLRKNEVTKRLCHANYQTCGGFIEGYCSMTDVSGLSDLSALI